MHSIETTKRLNSPERGNGRKYKGTLKEDSKVKTKTYTLTEDEISDIADRELGAEGFWQDGEVDLKGALKGLEYMMERNHISRITYDFYSTGKEEWK